MMNKRWHFTKMHGAGNDFVVVDLRDDARSLTPEQATLFADRHRGIGCDQVLTIEAPRSRDALASYAVWNADGSHAAQCGNGARCVAAWLMKEGVASGFWLDSPSGTHWVERSESGGFSITMGSPRFAPAEIPLRGFAESQDEYSLILDSGDRLELGAVSMGNPHAVIPVVDVETADVSGIGAQVQRASIFPASCNVGFVEVVDRGHIRLRVFERGSGETLACGSGACAAAAVMMRWGRVDREVIVSLPGGDLRIGWPTDEEPLTMTGPAAFVFEGEWIA